MMPLDEDGMSALALHDFAVLVISEECQQMICIPFYSLLNSYKILKFMPHINLFAPYTIDIPLRGLICVDTWFGFGGQIFRN